MAKTMTKRKKMYSWSIHVLISLNFPSFIVRHYQLLRMVNTSPSLDIGRFCSPLSWRFNTDKARTTRENQRMSEGCHSGRGKKGNKRLYRGKQTSLSMQTGLTRSLSHTINWICMSFTRGSLACFCPSITINADYRNIFPNVDNTS